MENHPSRNQKRNSQLLCYGVSSEEKFFFIILATEISWIKCLSKVSKILKTVFLVDLLILSVCLPFRSANLSVKTEFLLTDQLTN
jgi:hypothetical protein